MKVVMTGVRVGLVLALAGAFGGVLAGCQTAAFDHGAWHERVPRYGWGFYNDTAGRLDGVAITWAAGDTPFGDGAGVLMPSCGKGSGGGPDPIPPTVTVRWQTPDGVGHRLEVAVAAAIPDLPHFTGIAWFKFTPGGGVVMVPMTEAERRQRLQQQRPVFPI